MNLITEIEQLQNEIDTIDAENERIFVKYGHEPDDTFWCSKDFDKLVDNMDKSLKISDKLTDLYLKDTELNLKSIREALKR